MYRIRRWFTWERFLGLLVALYAAIWVGAPAEPWLPITQVAHTVWWPPTAQRLEGEAANRLFGRWVRGGRLLVSRARVEEAKACALQVRLFDSSFETTLFCDVGKAVMATTAVEKAKGARELVGLEWRGEKLISSRSIDRDWLIIPPLFGFFCGLATWYVLHEVSNDKKPFEVSAIRWSTTLVTLAHILVVSWFTYQQMNQRNPNWQLLDPVLTILLLGVVGVLFVFVARLVRRRGKGNEQKPQ